MKARPNPPRLSEGDSDAGRLLSRAREQSAESRPGLRERVWRTLSEPRRSPVRWLVPVALVAAAALVVVVRVWTPASSQQAFHFGGTLALTSGTVETARPPGWTAARIGESLEDGVRVRTAAGSRSFARFPGVGVLLLGTTQVRLGASGGQLEVRVDEGTVVVAARTAAGCVVVARGGATMVDTGTLYAVQVAAEQTVGVSVFEGTARVRDSSGASALRAGQSWSSPAGGSAQVTQSDLALARALAAGMGDEAPLELQGVAGTPVSVDGVALGAAPVALLASVGPHTVSAQYGGQVVTSEARVAAGAPTRLTLPAQRVQPAPVIGAPPSTPLGLNGALNWSRGPADTYEQARRLTAEGHHAEAVALYQTLAVGDGARAEASLYEVGRLRLRFLSDAKGALAAFSEHQRRFPDGALDQEVGLSAIEAQLQLGELAPALAAMDRFLARFPSSERLGDVKFLKAQAHTDLGHCERALPLFLQLLDEPTHAEEALYLAAWCEGTLDQRAAARAHLTRYLSRFPAGPHAAEARAALGPAK